MIEACSLSSGSNGNAFFIKTGDDSFLVDAGISCKQICLRLEEIQGDPGQLKGIFITHEHSDHTRGLRVFLKKYPTPVYISQKTYHHLREPIGDVPLHFIDSTDRITVNRTEIRSLSKNHDAVDPSLFLFYYKKKTVGVVTDVGSPCANVVRAVKAANILFLETNYDEVMLEEGFYPPYLKRRISGKNGHLSNSGAGELIRAHAEPTLEYIFLSHLSENNNTPDIAMKTFEAVIRQREDLRDLQTILTSRTGISTVVKMKADA